MSVIDEIKALQARQEEILSERKSLEDGISELNDEFTDIEEKISLAIGVISEYEKKENDRAAESQAAFNSLLVRLEASEQLESVLAELKTYAIDSMLELPERYTEPPTEEEGAEKAA